MGNIIFGSQNKYFDYPPLQKSGHIHGVCVLFTNPKLVEESGHYIQRLRNGGHGESMNLLKVERVIIPNIKPMDLFWIL